MYKWLSVISMAIVVGIVGLIFQHGVSSDGIVEILRLFDNSHVARNAPHNTKAKRGGQDDSLDLKRLSIDSSDNEETKLSVVVVGDVMLGRSVNTRMIKYHSVDWPFEQVTELLGGADIALGNLENPLIAGCPATDEGMIFCGRVEAAPALARAGFDGMSLANNHSFNHGTEGVRETEQALEVAGLQPMGNGKEGIFEARGVKIGVLAYDDVTAPVEMAVVEEDVKRMKERVDILLVMVHWGVEYMKEPVERQIELGRAMIDSGVDVVLGSHPHWTQPVEEYKDGLIFYSLGNFVFDQMWSEQTRSGEIALLELKTQNSKLKNIEYELVPVVIEDFGQPRIVGSSQELVDGE